MELIGKRYLIEHITEQYTQEEKRNAFELYVSEMMRSVTNTLSNLLGGASFPKSWTEMLEYKPEKRTAEEIENNIVGKLHALGGT